MMGQSPRVDAVEEDVLVLVRNGCKKGSYQTNITFETSLGMLRREGRPLRLDRAWIPEVRGRDVFRTRYK